MPTIASSRTFSVMSSSVSTRGHTFLSQFILSMTLVILLVGFCPYVSSSPTPSSIEQNKNVNYQSNGFLFDPNDSEQTAEDAALLSSSVQEVLTASSPSWYVQPRANANQFLISNLNDNQIIVPKHFTRFNHNVQINDDDDDDDYIQTNKRSTVGNKGTFSKLNKRKQLTKPPMEVMNEIVNSIYLKR
ncbi:hypothetical protein I4U23_017700 [Adineta vaga]|nr:hypothetical protein I4U23_017700 [Adineta vaga]